MYVAKFIKQQNQLILPFGEARYAPIAAEDLDRVVASILADPVGHAGQVYPLFCPKELTQYEIAGILSEVLGRKITYVPMEIEAFKGVLKDMGHTPHFIQHVSAVAQDCRDGIFSGTNDLVEKLTDQKPLQMVDYIVKNKALFS